MKRAWITCNYKRNHKRKSIRQEQRKLDFKLYRRRKNRGSIFFSKPKNLSNRENVIKSKNYVNAPFNFSFKRNPESIISFISDLEDNYKRNSSVFVNVREIKKIDQSAILVLLSILAKFKSKGINFKANLPKDEDAARKLIKSGFFEHLRQEFTQSEEYYFQGQEYINGQISSICTHGQKIVNSKLCADLLLDASITIWNKEKRCKGAFRVMVEIMQNTNNHAQAQSFNNNDNKLWWLSVNHDHHLRKVKVCFVDYGIGIFKSLSSKKPGNFLYEALVSLQQKFKYRNNAELLRLILTGELHRTATGKPNRGKGLPSIYETMKKGQIDNLVIISNNIFADISSDDYKIMNQSFSGTFIQFEINSNTKFAL